ASVFGRHLATAALANATGTPLTMVMQRLADLCARGVLRARDDGSYVFSHALVRDAFYERIPENRRRELHHSMAIALARDGDGDGKEGQKHAALVAHHMLAALPLVSAHDAVRSIILAAEAARARSAPEEAIALLERAFTAVEHLDVSEADRIELLLAL